MKKAKFTESQVIGILKEQEIYKEAAEINYGPSKNFIPVKA